MGHGQKAEGKKRIIRKGQAKNVWQKKIHPKKKESDKTKERAVYFGPGKEQQRQGPGGRNPQEQRRGIKNGFGK